MSINPLYEVNAMPVSLAQSEQIDGLMTALVTAQARMTAPSRNRSVSVKTKTGGKYEFRYATLDHLIEHVRQPLTNNGLWFTQRVICHEGEAAILTTLAHTSGQFMHALTPVPYNFDDGLQAFGSAITYIKRYALDAILGLASQEDDDGNGAEGNEVLPKAPVAAKKPRRKTPESEDKALILEAQGATSVSDLNVWWKSNQDRLEALLDADADRFEGVRKAVVQHRKMLNQETVNA